MSCQDHSDNSRNLWCCSGSCVIPHEERMVVTGGRYSRGRVTAYTEAGAREELPQLLTPRQDHACASFVNEDNLAVGVLLSYS